VGITYHGHNDTRFDVNFCGAELLWHAHRSAGAAIYVDPDLPDLFQRVPYAATADEAIAMADALDVAPPEAYKALFDGEVARGWDGTPEEYIAWVREWSAFLRKSGGYDSW
jgi:hypothetical protein